MTSAFVGTDQHGDAMRLDLHVTPSRAPVPLGAAAYNGNIECFGQATTYSYFQTGMAMTGTLSWGIYTETVTGTRGPRRPAMVSHWSPTTVGGTGDIRVARPRVAHDQPGQRRRPEHMAAVRPDESQCAAAVFGCDDEFSRRRSRVCRRHRGHRHQLCALARVGPHVGARRRPRHATCPTAID